MLLLWFSLIFLCIFSVLADGDRWRFVCVDGCLFFLCFSSVLVDDRTVVTCLMIGG